MPRTAKRVIVLDTHAARGRVRAALVGSGFDVVTATSLDESVELLRGRYQADLLVLGQLDEGTGEAALARCRQILPGLPIVMVVEGQDSGTPLDGRTVSVGRARLAEDLDRAVMELLAQDDRAEDPFIVASPPMLAVRQLVRQVAATDVPVLITGDSGVGKEVIARALHRDSDRADMPFVKVNCAALPDQLLESELFGYERGAFTGADRDKPGKFELANGGTIFLDEIGEMPAGIQAKLLQVLQDGRYYRLGGDGEVRIDARVVASTNVDIERAIQDGSFRKDLFYRLNVVRIQVPPLRDRREEILLVEWFQARYEREYSRQAGDLSDPDWQRLAAHDWPGNVRELENLVRRMVVLQDIDGALAELQPQVIDSVIDARALLAGGPDTPSLKDASRLAAMEVEGVLIRRALEQTGWNRRQAAKLLQISYKALLYKIRDCGIQAA